MKTLNRVLILLLVLTLGTATACSSDEPQNNNRNNNSDQLEDSALPQDADDSARDVDSAPKDTDSNADDTNTEDTSTGPEDTDSADTLEEDTSTDPEDTGDNNDGDTDSNDEDTGSDENAKLLKDLTEEEILTLCAADATKVHEFFDPTTSTGTAYCLLYAAYFAFDAEKSPSEIQETCNENFTSCTESFTEPNPTLCINTAGCQATVEDFERCSYDNLQAFQEQINPLLEKTCADFTTEQSIEILDEAFDNYLPPQGCIDLEDKCPNIYTW